MVPPLWCQSAAHSCQQRLPLPDASRGRHPGETEHGPQGDSGPPGRAVSTPASQLQARLFSSLWRSTRRQLSTQTSLWCPHSISRKRGWKAIAAFCPGSGTGAPMGCESTPPLRGRGQRRGKQGAQSMASCTPSAPHSSCVLQEEMLPRVQIDSRRKQRVPRAKENDARKPTP